MRSGSVRAFDERSVGGAQPLVRSHIALVNPSRRVGDFGQGVADGVVALLRALRDRRRNEPGWGSDEIDRCPRRGRRILLSYQIAFGRWPWNRQLGLLLYRLRPSVFLLRLCGSA